MKIYDDPLVLFGITTAITLALGLAIKWFSSKLRKIDETQSIKADLVNHKKDYDEFKEDTKKKLDTLDERTYNQKK